MEHLEQDFRQYDVSLKEDKNMLECFETGITFYIDKLIRELMTAHTVAWYNRRSAKKKVLVLATKCRRPNI